MTPASRVGCGGTIPRVPSAGTLLLLERSVKHATPSPLSFASSRDADSVSSSPPSTPELHPDDYGLDLVHVPTNQPLELQDQEVNGGPDAVGIISAEPLSPGTSPTVVTVLTAPGTPPSCHAPHLAPAHPDTAAASTPSAATPAAAAGPAHGCGLLSPPVPAPLPGGEDTLDALPGDVLAAILACLDPRNRHAARGTCGRLLTIAHPFRALAVALPAASDTAHDPRHAPATMRANLAALPQQRFDTIHTLDLVLPEVTDRWQLRALEDPARPLNAWLASYLRTGQAGEALQSLRVRGVRMVAPQQSGAEAQDGTKAGSAGGLGRAGSVSACPGGPHSWGAPSARCGSLGAGSRAAGPLARVFQNTGDQDEDDEEEEGEEGEGRAWAPGSLPTTSISRGGISNRSWACRPGGSGPALAPLLPRESGAFISGRALQLLAAHCPNLASLSLPLLAPGAATALPALAPSLRSLTLSVQDSGLVDAALLLPGLTHLSLATHRSLLSLTLHPAQVQGLAQIRGLQSLHLSCALIPDSDAAWAPLSALTRLTELRVSFPLDASRLKCLPQLKALQLPLLSTTPSLSSLVAQAGLTGLTELRCGCVLREEDALALAVLTQLHTLQVDSVQLHPPPDVPALVLPPPAAAGTAPIAAAAAAAAAARVGAGVPALASLAPIAAAASAASAAAGGYALQQGGAIGQGNAPLAALGVGAVSQVPLSAAQPMVQPMGLVDIWAASQPAPGFAGDGAGASSDPGGAPAPAPPPWARTAAHYAGLQLPSVQCLVLTGTHTYRGELGAVFPNLDTLAVAHVGMVGAGKPVAAAVPLPRLRKLAWPANRAAQAMLAAAPALQSLSLTGVTSAARLEAALGADGAAVCGDAADITRSGQEDLSSLLELSDGAHEAPTPEAMPWSLSGGEGPQGTSTGPQQPQHPPPGLRHMALALQGGAQGFKPRQLRAALERAPAALRSQLVSLTLRDLPGGRARGVGKGGGGHQFGAPPPPLTRVSVGGLPASVVHAPMTLATATAQAALAAAASLDAATGGASDADRLEGVFGSLPNATLLATSPPQPAPRAGFAPSGQRSTDAGGGRRSSMDADALSPSSGQGGHTYVVDPEALAASGRLVDEGVVRGIVCTFSGLRSLRVEGCGALTSYGLSQAAQAASPRLERVEVRGCPRVRREVVEGLGAGLGRPWLRVTWHP